MVRNSNIELLRIICMLMIIIHHSFVHGVFNAYESIGMINQSAIDLKIVRFINPFCYCAVNVFVLISGYFGIRLKITNLTNLYIRCAVYGLLCYCVHLYLHGGSLGRWGIMHNCILAFTESRWFIISYLMLLLLSPILNKCIENINKQTFIWIIILLSVINIYFGWYRELVNPNGYNFMQFIFLYLIGRFIHLYNITISRWKSLIIYITCSVILGLLAVLLDCHSFSYKLFEEKYNNPILILEAIALLYFFLSFEFKSKFVNWIAKSVISVYLIHENKYIGRPVLINYFVTDWFEWGWERWLHLFITALFVLFGCLLIDKLLTVIFKPLSYLMNIIGNKVVCFINQNIRKIS
ncbi:MAG: acyltransferase family protein [Bacteroidia bacterium]|nr:acyltransferase family protein [Bacteroidia bacterium]